MTKKQIVYICPVCNGRNIITNAQIYEGVLYECETGCIKCEQRSIIYVGARDG